MVGRRAFADFILLLYHIGAEVILESPFPEGTGNVWLDNIVCTGTEKRLIDCSLNAIVGNSICSHSEDASMRCQPSS